MSKILIPVVGVAVVYVIAQGWMTAAWQSLYNIAHTGNTQSPIAGNVGPVTVVPPNAPGRPPVFPGVPVPVPFPNFNPAQ